jgi:hypothetical protein
MQRIVWDDNGTLNDISLPTSDYLADTQTIPIVAAEDKLYIGSDLPFFYRYFDVSTANATGSVVSVEIWDGTDWNAAVDVIDETSVGGASLAQSGYIRFKVNRNESWAKEATSEDVTGITTLKIYGKYWARLTWSADLDANTALNYIGFKFSNDSQLGARYADLNTTAAKSAWASGKTDWDDQHFEAAEEIIRELRHNSIIQRADQIVEPGEFREASVHKVAEIIMQNWGDEYEDNRLTAQKKYKSALKFNFPQIDSDGDGKADSYEKFRSFGFSRT